MAGQIPLSDDLLAVMRTAARNALDLREAFITPRTLLLALLDVSAAGPAIAKVVDREKVLAAKAADASAPARLRDDGLPENEQGAIVRYDSLAFKTPDGRSTVWLGRDAYRVFLEGAQRARERYGSKELALGLAAEAVRAPGVVTAIGVEPGVLSEAVYAL